jgi:hypothetical protein
VLKLDKTPTETYYMLQIVQGDEAISDSSVFERFKRFKDGHEDLHDDPRSGRPSTIRSTIANASEIVILDRRFILRIMSDELNMNKKIIHQSSMKIY